MIFAPERSRNSNKSRESIRSTVPSILWISDPVRAKIAITAVLLHSDQIGAALSITVPNLQRNNVAYFKRVYRIFAAAIKDLGVVVIPNRLSRSAAQDLRGGAQVDVL